jgi:hypothetical protein
MSDFYVVQTTPSFWYAIASSRALSMAEIIDFMAKRAERLRQQREDEDCTPNTQFRQLLPSERRCGVKPNHTAKFDPRCPLASAPER